MPSAVSSVVPLGRGAVLSGVWKGTWLHSARISLFDRFPHEKTRTLRSLGSSLSCDFDNPHGVLRNFFSYKRHAQVSGNSKWYWYLYCNCRKLYYYTESWRESWCFGQLQDLDCSSVKFQFDASWPVVFLVGWEIAEWVELWTWSSYPAPWAIGAGVTPKLTNCLQKSSFIGWWNMFRKLKHGELYYGTFQKNQLKVMGTKNLSTNLTKPTVASSPLDAETLVTRSYHSFLTLAAAIGSNSLKSLLVSKISGSFLKQATAIPSCRH